MARRYAPKAVLRQLPLHPIHAFLSRHLIHVGPTWDAPVDGDASALYRAWTELPPGDRERVEMMPRRVHEMASEAAVRGAIAGAAFRGADIAADPAAVDGHHAEALWALTNHPVAFHTARRLPAAASPVGRFWNLTTGFGGRPYDASPAGLRDPRGAVARLYREQGRGHRCTVEPYERDGCRCVFLYLDDDTETRTAHDVRGTPTRTPVRPAFEVVYAYTPGAGPLDPYARGDRRWRSALRDLFCEHVPHTSAPHSAPGRRSYPLNGLLDRSFPLATDPARGVVAAAIRRLRVTSVEDLSRRATPGANPDRPGDVYAVLDVHFPIDLFPRGHLPVSQVTFTVTHVAAGEDRARPLTFDVSFSDACNLKSLPHDHREVGEWCLRRWGILSDPAEGDESDPDDTSTGGADEGRAA